MREIPFDINEMHKVQYDILVEFDRICTKHNLTYYLAFGTLLGAIRQNGFIPWDDDIDTMMTYDDFLKLQKIDPSEWRAPYFLQTNETDKEYRRCYAKIRNSNTTLVAEELSHLDINHGVGIDIYPLVHLADDPKQRKIQYLNTMFFMLLRYDEPPRNHGRIYYYGGKMILKVLPKKVKKKLEQGFLNKLLVHQGQATREMYVIDGSITDMRRCFSSDWFKGAVRHPFENGEFLIPTGAVQFLENRYGKNYIQPPPKDQQGIKLDAFLKVDLDNPYTHYKGKYYCVGKRKSKVINKKQM